MDSLAYSAKDHEDYEIINGQIYMMSRPNVNHSRIERNISGVFKNYLQR